MAKVDHVRYAEQARCHQRQPCRELVHGPQPHFDARRNVAAQKFARSAQHVHRDAGSGIYRKYAQKNLPPQLVDAVDEEKLLAIKPPALNLPPEHERKLRMKSVLPEYREWERR